MGACSLNVVSHGVIPGTVTLVPSERAILHRAKGNEELRSHLRSFQKDIIVERFRRRESEQVDVHARDQKFFRQSLAIMAKSQ